MTGADAIVRPLIVLPADPEHLAIGGIASFVRGFVKHAPDDFEVSMIGLSASCKSGRWVEVSLEGRSVQFLPVAGIDASVRRLVPLALRHALGLALRRPEIRASGRVIQYHRPASALPLLRSSLPAVRVVHQTLDQLRAAEGESRWRWTGPLLRLVEDASLRRMDRVYVVDERGAEQYRQAFPYLRSRIAHVPNWVDGDVFHQLSPDERKESEASLLRRFDLGHRSELVLYAGRLEPTKRPALLLQAFGRLLEHRPDARLLVAGEGNLLGQARELATTLGVAEKVRFVGLLPRDELARLMNAARVLLISSLSETGPTVGIEALACGLPVVMTPVGQLSRIVRTRETGWVTGEHDADELARGAAWVLGQGDEDMRRRCAASIEPYTARAVLPRLYEDHRVLARSRTDTSVAVG